MYNKKIIQNRRKVMERRHWGRWILTQTYIQSGGGGNEAKLMGHKSKKRMSEWTKQSSQNERSKMKRDIPNIHICRKKE